MKDSDPPVSQYYVTRYSEVKIEDHEERLLSDYELLDANNTCSNGRKRQKVLGLEDQECVQTNSHDVVDVLGIDTEQRLFLSSAALTLEATSVREPSAGDKPSSDGIQAETTQNPKKSDFPTPEYSVVVKSEQSDELAALEESSGTELEPALIGNENDEQSCTHLYLYKRVKAEENEDSDIERHPYDIENSFNKLYEDHSECSSSDGSAYESDAQSENSSGSDNEPGPIEAVNSLSKLTSRFEFKEDGKFMYPACSQPFSSVQGAKTHMRMTHIKEKQHRCNICLQSMSTKVKLAEHMKSHRAPEGPVDCPICTEQQLSKEQYNTHLRRHMGDENNQCKICDRILTTRQSFIKHVLSHSGQPGRFECVVCHKKLSRRETLANHMNIHTGEKPFKCHICDKGLSTKQTLGDHVRTHTGERPHVCNICQKRFAAKNNLLGHLETHAVEKLYECTVCSKKLCTKLVLTDHMRVHTGEKPFKCTLCSKDFQSRNALGRHTRKTHRMSMLSIHGASSVGTKLNV